jgi:hypothetical protein
MTQTPFFDEEELKQLEEQYQAEDAAVKTTAPTPETIFKTPTAEENKKAGNVQPVKSPAQQGIAQLTGNKPSQPKPDPNKPLNPGSGFMYGSGDPNANLAEDLNTYAQNTMEGIGTLGMGLIDFGMDAIGRIPGAERIDDGWDQKTKFQNPVFSKVRELASIVLPSLAVGRATGSIATGGSIAKAAGVLGINLAGDVAINMVSDQSTGKTLANMVKEAAPWMPVPDALVVKPTDSPEERRYKNTYESAGLSVIGDIIGFASAGGRAVMDWFQPNDEVAKAYKATEAVVNMDSATAARVSELQTQRAAVDAQGTALSQVVPTTPEEAFLQNINLDELRKTAKGLQDESVELTSEYLSKGSSRVTENPFESFVERQQISRELQIDEVGKSRLMDDPLGVDTDPFITPHMFPEGSSAALSIEPGAVARNAGDVAAIKLGGSTGTPVPLLSERAYYDISQGNARTRDIVAEMAEAHRAAGNFDAIIDGFRYTKAQMSDGAWKVYTDIMQLGDVKKIQDYFLDGKDVKTLLDGRKVKYLNDVQAEGVGYAMKDLVQKYIGKDVTEQSARVMDTLGREISDIADGFKALPETADAVRVNEMIGDRLAFLMEEYGLNKYIAGWSLKAQDRWKMMFQKGTDKEATVKQLMSQFDLKRVELGKRAEAYKQMLQTAQKEHPEAMQALIDAFALSNGDVDTIAKLMNWAARQMNPLGLVKPMTDEGGLNAFAQGAWAVRYGNVLGGLSAARAIVGNGVNLLLRPINSYLGTGIQMMLGNQGLDDLKRVHYSYTSVWATNNRALGDAWNHFRKLNTEGKWGDDLHLRPHTLARADLETGDRSLIEVLDQMVPTWEKEGNIARLWQYKGVKLLHQIGNWNMLKYGTNALQSADMLVRTNVATQMARFRAYDEVMSLGYKGQELADQLAKAEKLAYGEMFDSAGEITDAALQHASGEIALQLDDATANFVNIATAKLPFLKPFFMFPKTGMNGVKLAMSYTPIARLMPKYGAVLGAGNDLNKIKEALLQHGIDFDTTPNAMSIFKGLQAEYSGRLAFSSLLTTGLFGYALSGKVRGNGPPNKSERQKLQNNFNWNPKTINIGGKWVSYAGYEPLDTVLTTMADLAYYATDIGSPLVEDYQTKIAWTLAATFVNKTFVQGLDPLLAIIDGDEARLTRFLANEARAAIPWSGAMGVAANAISSTQKDVYNDLMGYVANRLPGLNTTLPDQIDIFTGKPINDIDNHVLRALNAVNPVKISEGTEPWRQWLINTGWDGIQQIRKDSTGNHEYTSTEREVLYKYIGEQQIWKEYDRLSKNKKYNDQLDRIRAMRVEGYDSKEIKAASSEVYGVLDDILKNAQKVAEQRLQSENEPMWRSIQESIRSKDMMKQGRIDDARRSADRRRQAIEELTQMYK